MDAIPLIDAQTAAILGSVQKYTVQQHDKISVNCVEQPNTYTIYNLETQQALIRVEEQSECCTRCFCAPDHSVVLQFNALDPAGNAMFPGGRGAHRPTGGELTYKEKPQQHSVVRWSS